MNVSNDLDARVDFEQHGLVGHNLPREGTDGRNLAIGESTALGKGAGIAHLEQLVDARVNVKLGSVLCRRQGRRRRGGRGSGGDAALGLGATRVKGGARR